ncbi:MAG: hypothetical protein ACOC56_01030 [Atribacterota bacterium]
MAKFRDVLILEEIDKLTFIELLDILEEGMYDITNKEIADIEGITKQYVSKALKSGLKKVWKNLKNKYPNKDAVDLIRVMAEYLRRETIRDKEELFEMLPNEIKSEVMATWKTRKTRQ